jgi:hypothetical protein
MSHPIFRFYFQNFPSLPFTKWFSFFNENLKERNARNFLFADSSISNNCFVKSIISNKVFLNIFTSPSVADEIKLIEDNIKKYCESLLLKGYFSESKIDLFSDKTKDLVLRNYASINLQDFLDESWEFYFKNKPNIFYKLSEYYNYMPFSYIWSFFFADKNAEALALDPYVMKNRFIFERNIKLKYEIEKDKKYKIVYFDTLGKKIDINVLLDKVEQNGLLVLKNLDIDGPNMVGWRDLRGRMIGIMRV